MRRIVELTVEQFEEAIVAYVEAKGLKPAPHDAYMSPRRQHAGRMMCLGRKPNEGMAYIDRILVDAVQVEIEEPSTQAKKDVDNPVSK